MNSGPTVPENGHRGRVVFLLLLILFSCIAIWFAMHAGPAGIEERFSSALGLAHEGEGQEHDGESGFAIEGSPVLYLLVLVLAGLACWALYRKFGV